MKTRYLARRVKDFQTLETPQGLWHLLKTTPKKAELLIKNPLYNIFTVPKRNGSSRTIEDPCDELKIIQDRLNDYLQPMYFFNRTNAAYGYIIRPDGNYETRNILTNAKRHCKSSNLFNIDVKDFFHYVKWQTIYDRLTATPFKIHYNVAKVICDLCTLEGRLPMGAPTSPALSNVAVYSFDKEVEQYCAGENMIYTRYVDDMSFSGDQPITQRHFNQLSTMIIQHGYELKAEKIKWFSGTDKKMITGLLVQEGLVSVPEAYVLEIEKEIKNLQAYVLMQTRLHPNAQPDYRNLKPVQKIKGALAFVESVHGDNNVNVQRLYTQLEQAIEPPADYESLNWLEIGYTVF